MNMVHKDLYEYLEETFSRRRKLLSELKDLNELFKVKPYIASRIASKQYLNGGNSKRDYLNDSIVSYLGEQDTFMISVFYKDPKIAISKINRFLEQMITQDKISSLNPYFKEFE